LVAWLRSAFNPSSSSTTATPHATSESKANPAPSDNNDNDKAGLFSQAQASAHEAIIYPVYAYSTSISNTGNPIGDSLPDASQLSLYRGPTTSEQDTPTPTTTTNQTTASTMATDEDYAAFLEKANQPTSSSVATSAKTSKGFTGKSVDTREAVPEVLRGVESVYVSEADEEFVPVSLGWRGEGGEIDVGMLSFAIMHGKRRAWHGSRSYASQE